MVKKVQNFMCFGSHIASGRGAGTDVGKRMQKRNGAFYTLKKIPGGPKAPN
jgi:hypothetical protein